MNDYKKKYLKYKHCVVSRAIPIVKSMTSVIIYDLLLKQLSR